ncbi:MAG: phosphoglucosamine mutase, partial [Pseudomonadota bacterium]
VVDGDRIMALIATRWASEGRLRGGKLVATVMSNLGLERYLAGCGIGLERAKVGDRYVVEAMRAGGYNLGGEQSGHIVMSDHVTTGDGLMASLQVLEALLAFDRPLSIASALFDPLPQILKNVRYSGVATPLDDPAVRRAIAAGEARLRDRGRLLIRKSGTEPLIRVMGEAEDEKLLATVVDDICAALTAAAEA